MGRALEGEVFSDYFQWACSVLYYSYDRTHAHDPATHLALVPMQPVFSKGLIKQFRGSGPSPSIALLFTALLLPNSLHNCFWLCEKKYKIKKWNPPIDFHSEDIYLPRSEEQSDSSLSSSLSATVCLLSKEKSPTFTRMKQKTYRPIERNYIEHKYLHLNNVYECKKKHNPVW